MKLAAGRFPVTAACDMLLGSYFSALGQWPEAAQAFRKAVDKNPRNDVAWASLAAALAFDGKAERAIEAVQAALELNPSDADSLLNIALVYLKSGNSDGVAAIVQRLERTDDPRAHTFARRLKQEAAAQGR
jgi:peroxin-5